MYLIFVGVSVSWKNRHVAVQVREPGIPSGQQSCWPPKSTTKFACQERLTSCTPRASRPRSLMAAPFALVIRVRQPESLNDRADCCAVGSALSGLPNHRLITIAGIEKRRSDMHHTPRFTRTEKQAGPSRHALSCAGLRARDLGESMSSRFGSRDAVGKRDN